MSAEDGDDQGMETGEGQEGDSDLSDSSDSEEDDDERRHGMDRLQSTHGIDIPTAQNIPIVSLLAKEENKQDKSNQKEATKKRITEFIEQDEEELETHFVENPYIKLKRATQKQLESKNQLNADELMDEQDTTA